MSVCTYIYIFFKMEIFYLTITELVRFAVCIGQLQAVSEGHVM